MCGNTRYMCIILVANIIWCYGYAIRSSSLLDPAPFSTVVADLSFGRPLNGDFFDRQILLSMRKKMVKEDSLVAESITSNFKYSHQPGKRKKIFVSLGKFIMRWKKKKFYITCLSCESFKIKPFLFAEKIPFELWTNKILLRDMEKRVTSLFQYWCHF